MTDRELMQQALDALLRVWHSERNIKHLEAIEALRARLAQPNEPDWSAAGFGKPQREWQGLTDEERTQLWDGVIKYIAGEIRINDFARAIEAKLKEKNG